jgi:ribosomal protein S18 acetylase RimI-like enzyme
MDIEALRRGAETPSQAARGDLPGVAADLSDAFADDVLFDWWMRPDGRREAARLAFFRLIVTHMAFGVGSIERPATGGAAAIWLPFASLKPTPLATELRALPVLLQACGVARFSRLTALRAMMDAHHPMDRPHAYLMFLGVSRRAQGLGVGSRLLKVGTDRCDAAGQAAYLETQTERNISLYRRHGFEVISENRARADAPPMWSMWREPRVREI